MEKLLTPGPHFASYNGIEIALKRKECTDLGIEKDVIDAVVMLQLFGFPTSGSCEGHAEKNSFPWIYFVVEKPTLGKREDFALWKEKTSGLINHLDSLLSEFYITRNIPRDQRLKLAYADPASVVPFACFTLYSAGVESLDLLPSEIITKKERKNVLIRYQKELSDFAKFLQGMYSCA